jgi:hypothetical protein
MRVDTGMFGHFLADGMPDGFFAARILIPTAEFPRLGLGEHEKPSAIPACLRWCHARFGVGGTRWLVRLPPDADAVLYFAERDDALAFLAHWSPSVPADRTAMPARRSAARALRAQQMSA